MSEHHYTENAMQLGEEFQLECTDQQQAEMGKDREHNAWEACLFVLRLIEDRYPHFSAGASDGVWNHLRTLCYECGVDYRKLLKHGIGH